MKRTILALMLILSILTGCGAATNNMGYDNAMQESATAGGKYDSYDNGGDYGGDYDYGWSEEPKAEDTQNVVTGSDVSGSALSDAKMIYSADLTLETRDFDAANSALAQLVSAVGGYFERSELNQGGNYRSVYCVIRVPASRFTEFLEQAGEVAHMTYCNKYSDNVSEAYYDLEARLTTQRTKLQRLQELLAKAENMADIITIESAISETELQIEYLTGSLRSYDSLIDFSTIDLSLREVYRLSNEEVTPVTFGDRLATAFRRGLEQGVDNLEDFVIYVARNWLTLIVWALVISGAVVLIRRRWSKRNGARKLWNKEKTDSTDEN